MANYKTYGKILIATGIALGTGTFLWNGGTDKRRYGEAIAELAAGAEEREFIPYILDPDDEWKWPTNRVVEMRTDFSFFYNEILVDARNWLTNGALESITYDADLDFYYYGDPVHMYWLAADIDDGEPLAESVVVWTNRVLQPYTWDCADPADATDHTLCTSSIVDDDISAIMPHTKTFDLPLLDELYPDIDSVQTNGIFGGSNNWWYANGMGTNVYKYYCEYWENAYGGFADITHIAGVGFTLATNRIFYGVGGFFEINPISISGNEDLILAELWEVSLDREGGSEYTARFAVGDSENSNGPTNIILSSYSLSVTEGSTTTFELGPKWDTGAVDTISWTVPGGGVTALHSNQTFFIWGPGYQDWDIPITITVTAPEDSNSEDGAALISFVKQAGPRMYAVR